MAQIKKARLSQMWYSCERWWLLAAELSRSSKASWKLPTQLSSGCNRVVITQTWTQSSPVKKCSLHNVVITTLAKLRHVPAYAPLGIVQLQQNLSKLNYEAICHIFDVIKIEAPAGMYIDQRVRKQPPMFGHYVSKVLAQCFIQSSGASRSGPIIPLWQQKWWLLRSGEGCWLVITSGKGQPRRPGNMGACVCCGWENAHYIKRFGNQQHLS